MTRPTRLTFLLFSVALVLVTLMPFAGAQSEERTADVVDLSGIWDERIIDFAIESIEDAASAGTVEYVILAIDSEGVVAGVDDLQRLADVVTDPPLPVVTWVGPGPAKAYGGAAQIAVAANLKMAAPGSEIGYFAPTIAGDAGSQAVGASPQELLDVVASVEDSGLFDEIGSHTAAPRQIGQWLDGQTFEINGETVTVASVREFDGGVTNVITVFRAPTVFDQFFRLAATPEAAFFFLVAGLTIAAFEFYAIGPGIAAGTAAVSLVLAGYGLAVLPMRWWAVVVAVLAVLLMSWSYQRGGIAVFTGVGILMLLISGFLFTDAAPQIRPTVPGVLLTVASAAFFFLMAMPTVARSRFSTQTIGREGLIGREGVAASELTPDGEVEVDGAKWRATSHREAGISTGDTVIVVGVDGWYLEVEPPIEN